MVGDPVLAVAVRAVRRAAAVVIDAARDLKRLPTFSKEHADIVTSADVEAQSAIVATISAAFPEHAIAGGDAEPKTESPYRWVVDPIDGTVNFVHGFPYYAVSVALVHHSEITHAAVLDPIHDELFTAVLGTVFPARKSTKLAAFLPIVNDLIGRCAGVRRAGSCALDLAHLAAGRL